MVALVVVCGLLQDDKCGGGHEGSGIEGDSERAAMRSEGTVRDGQDHVAEV
jgi:hypothetical protein